MRVASAPPMARVAAVAGLFWLALLASLGGVDFLTRGP